MNPPQVSRLTAEIERLKRKALSRGVNLTSKDEDVPSEDVAMLRQVFALADTTGDGFINEVELGQMHQVLGEPLSEQEVHSAFKAMDANRSGSVNFDDFLGWCALSSRGRTAKTPPHHHRHRPSLRPRQVHARALARRRALQEGPGVHQPLQEDDGAARRCLRRQACAPNQ
jgi:hypothetical protein